MVPATVAVINACIFHLHRLDGGDGVAGGHLVALCDGEGDGERCGDVAGLERSTSSAAGISLAMDRSRIATGRS